MELLRGVSNDWIEALGPPNTFDQIRHLEAYIRTDNGKKSSRRIFNHVPFTEYEVELLAAFHSALDSEGLDIPDWWTNSDSLKMVYHAKHDPQKAVDSFREHVSWRIAQLAEPRPSQVSQLANSTFLFSLGKDKQFRPIVYIRLQVMKNKSTFGLDESITYENIDKTIDWYLCLVRQCCFRRYFIENWVMILDCEGLSVFGFPVKFFTQLMKIMQLNHAATMHKMFILNPPTGFGAIFSAAKGFMSPDTLEKINMLSKNDFTQIQEVIDPQNLLEEYGGTLKRPPTIWPPSRLPGSHLEQPSNFKPENKEESEENPFVYQPKLKFSMEHPKKGVVNVDQTSQNAIDPGDVTGDPLHSPSRAEHLATDALDNDQISVDFPFEGSPQKEINPNVPKSLLDKPVSIEARFSGSLGSPHIAQWHSQEMTNGVSRGTEDKVDTNRSIIDSVTVEAMRSQPGIQSDPLGLFSQETQGLNSPSRPGQQPRSALDGFEGKQNFGSPEASRKAKQKSWCAACCEQCNLI